MISTRYLKVLPSRLGGNGLFTTVKISARYPIIEVTGNLFKNSNLPQHPAVLQVGPDLFIGPSGGPDDIINHSCNPNCLMHVVGSRAVLYSLYVIPPNAELTFDYSTTSTDSLDSWKMECNCGDLNCRKTISGLQYLKPELVDSYKQKGMIPLFMKEKIFR